MTPAEARTRLEKIVADTMAYAIERDEWDLQANLLLWFASDDTMVDVPMPGFGQMVELVDGHIGQVPRVAANLVRKAREDGVRLFERLSGDVFLAGIMFMHEGWGFLGETLENNREAIDAWLDAGRSIADHPLGVETRNITVVGLGSYVYAAVHVRGTPEPMLLGSDVGEQAQGGGLPIEGMRDLRNAINEQLRAGG